MYVAEDRKWRAVVSTIINRGLSQSSRNPLSNVELLGSEEGLGTSELVTKLY
jgi:hypothetical protein